MTNAPSHFALLRGINVGTHNRLAMAEFRALLAELGYRDIATVLQSGNAVFSAEEECQTIAAAIETALSTRFSRPIRCLVGTSEYLATAVRANPFPERVDQGSKLLALFLSGNLEEGLLTSHDPTALAPDQIRVGNGVIYQWCPDGVLAAPPVSSFVEKTFAIAVTGRNWNTVRKLAALVSAR